MIKKISLVLTVFFMLNVNVSKKYTSTYQIEAATITFTIDNGKMAEIVDAMWFLYPVDCDTLGVPLFTPNQWAKERTKKWIVDQVDRWNDMHPIDSIKAYNDSVKAVEGDDWIQ